MVTWKYIDRMEAKSVWDEWLFTFDHYSVFQSFAWGEYKDLLGWHVERIAAFDGKNKIAACIQILVRKYPLGITTAWVPGGPVGNLSSLGGSLLDMIKARLKVKSLYIRIYPNSHFKAQDDNLLRSQGWQKATTPLSSGLSSIIKTNQDEDQLMGNLSRNWRRNLKRGIKWKLSVSRWKDIDPDELHEVYRKMERYKNINIQYTKEEIKALIDCFGDNLVVFRWNGQTGETGAIRGCVIFGYRAWDILAAATPEARRCYASYVLFWKLIDACRNQGVEVYDMGGIDAVRAPGVYNFKKGAGGEDFQYLGEWDWATPEWLRWVANLLIAYKIRRV